MAIDTDEKIKEYFSRYPLRKYPKGQILIFSGEDTNKIYYLVEGKVKVYDISYRGDELILNIFKNGAFFPMSLAINKNQNNYFYKTETETTVRAAPAEEVIGFVKDNPDVLFDLTSRLYRGVDALLEKLVHLMSGTASERLMFEILTEARRFGEDGTNKTVLLRLTELDLANRCGLSRETVSREIHKLKKSGLVRLSKDGIVIEDISDLQARLD